MPNRMFCHMFLPSHHRQRTQIKPDYLKCHQNYGSVLIPSKSPAIPWTERIFHVAKTPCTVILGFTSSRQLQLVTLHNLTPSSFFSLIAYDVTAVQSKPQIRSIEGLKVIFPDHFYAIGHFWQNEPHAEARCTSACKCCTKSSDAAPRRAEKISRRSELYTRYTTSSWSQMYLR